MLLFPPTIIFRHRKENLKKCSLRFLENRADLRFYTYPLKEQIDLTSYVLLSFEGPLLTKADQNRGIVLIDGTWKKSEVMAKQILSLKNIEHRSLPATYRTAYPRRQEDCFDPERGLASVEALYIAYAIMGRDTAGLLDHYYWQESFLERNRPLA